MTVRVNKVGKIMVYAGAADELAEIADEYASGVRARPTGCRPELFLRAAAQLRDGRYPAADVEPIRFYRDHPNGEPFRGPFAPEPDEAWEQQQQLLKATRR